MFPMLKNPVMTAVVCCGLLFPLSTYPAFTDQTTSSLLNFSTSPDPGVAVANSYAWGGLSVGDFNNDGLPDLFVAAGGGTPDALFINQGNGTFQNQAAAWGFTDLYRGNGTAVGDYDNDGDLDLYVTSAGDMSGAVTTCANRLYRNNFAQASSTFTEVGATAMVNCTATTNAQVNPTGAAFGDYDLDGDLDLMSTTWAQPDKTTDGNRLFRNNGNGTFTDVTVIAQVFDTDFHGYSPRFADMNGDRYPELVVAADFRSSRYLKNNGNGTFSNLTASAGVGLDRNGMGSTIGDFNQDGLFDWYVTSIENNLGNFLYVNQGGNSFYDLPAANGANAGGWGWGSAALDYDNDGDVDIAETNGWNSAQYSTVPTYIYRNDGSLTFTRLTAGIDHTMEGRGLVTFDFDRDGDLDIVISSNNDRLGGPISLYENDASTSANWLEIQLDTNGVPGIAPNGMGSIVRILAGGVYQYFNLSGGSNFMGQSELIAHFGLNSATVVDEVLVQWPNGAMSTVTGVAANQLITVTPGPAGEPSISISNVVVTEGDSGTVNAIFTVSLSPISSSDVTVEFNSAGVTATSGIDYTAVSGTLTIPAGSSSGTISVPVVGDTVDEVNETFEVRLSNAVGANIIDPTGVGTIIDNESGAALFQSDFDDGVMDWTVTSGSWSESAGKLIGRNPTQGSPAFAIAPLPWPGGDVCAVCTVEATFSIASDHTKPALVGIVGWYQDANNYVNLFANAAKDEWRFEYFSSSAASQRITISRPIDTDVSYRVKMIYDGADLLLYVDDVLIQTVSGLSLAPGNIGIKLGYGSSVMVEHMAAIPDSPVEPGISIDDVSVAEGDSGTVNAIFTVSLSPISSSDVTVEFNSAGVTATSGIDYTAVSDTLTIPAGSSSGTISVPVVGDTVDEVNETFEVRLSNAVGANIIDPTGVGTIIDNESGAALFQSDFDDGVMDWTVTSGSWSESAGKLIGRNPTQGSPAFATAPLPWSGGDVCAVCTVEATFSIASDHTKPALVGIVGWYQDANNYVSLVANAAKDEWRFEYFSSSAATQRITISRPIDTDVSYRVKMIYDGADLLLYVDDVLIQTVSGLSLAPGNLGVKLGYGSSVSIERMTVMPGAGGDPETPGTGIPALISPVADSMFTSDTVTFNWTANGAAVSTWRLIIGTGPGQKDLHNSGVFSSDVLSTTVPGLPVDGSAIYVELQWRIGSDPKTVKSYSYTLASTEDVRDHSIARLWSDVLLNGIRGDFARPTVHSRNLWHISAAMYDAWAIYDDTATTYLLGKTVDGYACDFTDPGVVLEDHIAREEAISYAAYRMITYRFSVSPSAESTLAAADDLMQSLGYDTSIVSSNPGDGLPANIGNRIAECYITFGLQDGSNEGYGYANTVYTPVNPAIEPVNPGNPNIVDLDRWQPISLEIAIDQSGNPINSEPEFLGPEWGQVSPFSLTTDDLTVYQRDGFDYLVYHDPGMPPSFQGPTAEYYKWGYALVSVWSSHLDPTDGVMIDISPASIGNILDIPTDIADYDQFYDLLEGGDPSTGHPFNPATGQPYQPQMVPRGDYARVLAEFWADGPHSETPPGHWFTILNEAVSDHPAVVKRIGGEGVIVGPLEWDIKAYFALGGAMHDSAVAAWGIKGWYDYIRPISAIRALADLGQSSDNTLPNYAEDGIPLIPGYIELVESGDPLAGAAGEHVNKIKLLAWRGPDYITDPATDQAGVGWILAENWWSYQRPTFVTPPFAGYVSGHSTFSRAAAEVLTLLTGDQFFPGGMGEFEVKANEFLVFEEGPSVDMTLQWATYKDASEQTSLSRIWGGIHPPADDLPGRLIGAQIGPQAYNLAESYFSGQ